MRSKGTHLCHHIVGVQLGSISISLLRSRLIRPGMGMRRGGEGENENESEGEKGKKNEKLIIRKDESET